MTEGAELHRQQQQQQQQRLHQHPPPPAAAAAAAPAPPHVHFAKLRGFRLLAQQAWALLAKRALCARRERLAVLTQLLVPLALVWLSLWTASMSIREESNPALPLGRAEVLVGRPTAVAVDAAVRGGSWPAWLNATHEVRGGESCVRRGGGRGVECCKRACPPHRHA